MMEVVTMVCDACLKEIGTTVFRSKDVAGEYCSAQCLQFGPTVAMVEPQCPHEDNATDEVPGRTTARLVCKACGYDRTVNLETGEIV